MTSILLALIGALLGAYLNNIFSWKIKNTVEHLDLLYIEIFEINNLVYHIVTLKQQHNIDKLSKLNEEINTFYKELDFKFINSGALELHNSILKNKYQTELVTFTSCGAALANSYINNDKKEDLDEKHAEYKQSLEFMPNLLTYRNEVTSIKYFIKQIFNLECHC